MKLVQILMSTYNGAFYLREQMDSILNQDCEERGTAQLKLLVRDDGSTDETQQILEEYAEKYPDRVAWYQGGNQGVVGSFFDLLEKSPKGADYLGFADQDDYWLPEKVRIGIEHLERESSLLPNLYCCRCTLVDEQLEKLESGMTRLPMRPDFANALVENIVAGCTILMNCSLRDLIVAEIPEYTVMHDWWCYLVASCFGNVVYDEDSYILYRQHGKNAVGTNVDRWKELLGRIRRYRGNRGNISHQMEEFLKIYQGRALALKEGSQNLPAQERKMDLARRLLQGKKSFVIRWKLVCRGEIYRQRKADNHIFKLILLMGNY